MNVGLMKCGTTTLHEAAIKSGLTSSHHFDREHKRGIGLVMFYDRLVGNDPLQSINSQCVTQPDFCYYGLSIFPQCVLGMLKEVRKHNPNCAFILNTRNVDDHARSMWKWRNLQERLNDSGAPGLVTPISKQRLKDWILWHNDRLRRELKDDPKFFEIEIDKPEAPEILSKAINRPITWWGRANASPES